MTGLKFMLKILKPFNFKKGAKNVHYLLTGILNFSEKLIFFNVENTLLHHRRFLSFHRNQSNHR